MKSAYVVVNPAAGGGECGKRSPGVIQALEKAGWELDVVRTTRPGEATELARAAFERGVRTFFGAGGDGTAYELINGFLPMSLERGETCSLGLLPLGTGNSFLRDFTDHGEAAALNAIRENRTRAIDVNRLSYEGGELFSMNILSMGFTARVGAITNDRFKWLGEKGYILGVVSTLAGLQPQTFSLTIDGKEHPEKPLTLLSINNSQFTGGKMHIAPRANAEDGMCDIVEVGPMSRKRLLQLFPRIFKGTHVDVPEVQMSRGKHIEFRSSVAMDVMVDGEVTQCTPTTLETIPKALAVFI